MTPERVRPAAAAACPAGSGFHHARGSRNCRWTAARQDRRLDPVDAPDVQYARSGEVAIAYQTFGEGPIDLVFARGFAGDLLTTWEQPLLVRQLEDFAAIARVIMLDKRGTGLSDGFREQPTLETRMVERAGWRALGPTVRGDVSGAHDRACPLRPARNVSA